MICAITATYRRAAELSRLLDCLAAQTVKVDLFVCADNAAEPTIETLVKEKRSDTLYLPLKENAGCGAGLRAGEEAALARFGEKITHFWILDDDAVPPPDCLQNLLETQRSSRAGIVAPLCRTAEGKFWAFPEPLEPILRRIIREIDSPVEFRRQLQESGVDLVVPMAWCTGVCQLITRESLVKAGLHRPDFWMLGEDLELSMRISDADRGVFRADTIVDHLPPEQSPGPEADLQHQRKFLALLQNLTYSAFYVKGSRHMWSYLPGNYRRFFRTFGWSMRSLQLAFTALMNGLLFREPAGGRRGRKLLRLEEQPAR